MGGGAGLLTGQIIIIIKDLSTVKPGDPGLLAVDQTPLGRVRLVRSSRSGANAALGRLNPG